MNALIIIITIIIIDLGFCTWVMVVMQSLSRELPLVVRRSMRHYIPGVCSAD